MSLITITCDNIADEHICCAIADKKSITGVNAKKEWMKNCFRDGLKFKKLDVRGKVFIEYIPAENAWVPVNANGYVLINCHWVAGSFKGQGYGSQLLNECEKDALGTNGVIVIVGKKKKPFLSDKAFFLKQGYEVCDSADPYFELLVKRFNPKAELPQFKANAKLCKIENLKGIDIFYTAQCPFTVSYIDIIRPVINSSDIPIRTHQFTTKEEAQQHFCPVTTYTVFINGEYYSNEILSVGKLEKILKEI